jgi:hypothetical protein
MRRWAQLSAPNADGADGQQAAEPGVTKPRLEPQFLSAGTRHMLGYGPDYYGIWLRGESREYPMQVFPRSDSGWDLAWGRFCDLEPQHAQALGGLKWLVRKAH